MVTLIKNGQMMKKMKKIKNKLFKKVKRFKAYKVLNNLREIHHRKGPQKQEKLGR